MNIRKVSGTNVSEVSNDQRTRQSNIVLNSTKQGSTTTPYKDSITTESNKGTDPYKVSDLKFSIIKETPLNYADSASRSEIISLKGSGD